MAEGVTLSLSSFDEDNNHHNNEVTAQDLNANGSEQNDFEDYFQCAAAANSATSMPTGRDNWCDPCYKRNVYVPAHQYCPECQEYHCTDCGDFHGRFALGKSHSVLHGSQMPSCQPAKCLQYENCSQHVENHTDRFCIRHKELLCKHCVSDTHTSCEIKTVPEVSTDIDETDVCKFKSLLSKAKSDIKMKLSVFEKNISDVENQRKLLEQKLKGVHDAILFKLNKLFK